MVYTSWCLSLAALEVFVNLDPDNQPSDLVWLAVDAPVDEEWERSGRSAGLVVPSVLIEGEWNVLLNPVHADARKIRVVEKKPFRFDERMFRER
jgi:RES domain-containing protein